MAAAFHTSAATLVPPPNTSATYDSGAVVEISILCGGGGGGGRSCSQSDGGKCLSSLNPMTFFSRPPEREKGSFSRGGNQINPPTPLQPPSQPTHTALSLGPEPLICNLISGRCLGHRDTRSKVEGYCTHRAWASINSLTQRLERLARGSQQRATTQRVSRVFKDVIVFVAVRVRNDENKFHLVLSRSQYSLVWIMSRSRLVLTTTLSKTITAWERSGPG